MAEEQKPVEVPQETVPAPAEPVAAPAAEEPMAEEAPEATPAAAESSEAPKATEETPAAEEPAAAKEPAPVQAGLLEYKESKFPKNIVYSKKYFWFGSDSVDHKKLSPHVKAAQDQVHHILAWASETGNGLLFFGERHDEASPQGVIVLSEITEPTPDGTHKFHFSLKGNKHTFKTAAAADRDNWVAQLKLKIAEAKELATSVTETETYKKTLAGLKPTPAAKEVKKEDKPAEVAATAGAAVVAADAPAAAADAPAEDVKKDTKVEDSKRRSSSRKRGSIFGNLFPKKDGQEKKAETPADAKAAETEAPAEATAAPAASTETPAAAPEATETAPAAEPVSTEVPAEAKPEEAKPETKEAAKPSPSKRNSVFGNFSFGRKKSSAPEAEAAPAAPSKDAAEPTVTSDVAPVIPAVETTEPLSAEVNSPATVPVETVEVKPATNGADAKEVKSEKRKSSLPFAFGKKTAAEDTSEKPKSSSPFSKLRNTLNRKGKATEPTEKTEPAAEEGESSQAAEAPAEEAPKTEEPAAAAPVEETPAEQPLATTTPTVAATA